MPARRETAASVLTLPEAAALLGPCLFGSGAATGVVLAVSGGPDSAALMRLAAALRDLAPLRPTLVATVDHRLRPESLAEAEEVARWAAAAGLPHRILAWEDERPATRLQERARDARYRLLAAFARESGASHVLTAHTLDDQAETVLMRLSRGSGLAGLGGMRPEVARDGIVVARPFLAVAKARLVATCRAAGWPFLEDPANRDPRFARARLRALLPLLAAEGLTPERLATLAARARRVEDALAARVAAVTAAACVAVADGRLELDAAVLRAEPEEILLGVIGQALVAVAGPLARPVRLERLEALVLRDLRGALARGQACRLTLAGVLLDLRPGGRLALAREAPRRSGRRPDAAADAAGTPHSLGKGRARP